MSIRNNNQGSIENYSVALEVPSPSQGDTVSKFIALKGSFGTCFANFVDEGAAIRQPQKRGSGNVFDIYYSEKDYHAVLDILRNESPVRFVYWETDTYNFAMITTNDEEIGEGELRG